MFAAMGPAIKLGLTALGTAGTLAYAHSIWQDLFGNAEAQPQVKEQKAQERYLAALSDATHASRSTRDEATPALLLALTAMKNRLQPGHAGFGGRQTTGLAANYDQGESPQDFAASVARALSFQSGKPITANDLLEPLNEVRGTAPSDVRLMGFPDYYA